ncbi:MAG: hypothetical protein RLZZ352_28 [Pseudomonadota bacterium]|jgi:O-antigen/teichoic acid export membrane protein
MSLSLAGLKNYFVYGSGQIINLITPLLVAPKLIAVTGIDNFGKVGVATAVFSILLVFVDFGSLLLGVKNLSINKQNPEKIRQQLSETYAFRCFVILVLLSCSALATFFFTDEHQLYWLGLSFLVAQFFNPMWVYQAFEDFKTINRIIFVSKSLYISLVYLLVSKPDDYVYALFFLGLANSIAFSFYFYRLHAKYRLSLSQVSLGILLQNFKHEYPIVISSLSISVYTSAPILIVNHLLGEYMAGIYNMGDILLKIIRNYLSVFFSVSFPKFCTAYSANQSEGFRYLRKANGLNAALLTFGTVFAYVSTYFAVDTLDFSDHIRDAAHFCVHFTGLGLLIGLNIPFYQLLIYHNQQKFISAISVTGTLIMLSSCYLLTTSWGLSGSVASLYAVEFFMTGALILTYIFRIRHRQRHKSRLSSP